MSTTWCSENDWRQALTTEPIHRAVPDGVGCSVYILVMLWPFPIIGLTDNKHSPQVWRQLIRLELPAAFVKLHSYALLLTIENWAYYLQAKTSGHFWTKKYGRIAIQDGVKLSDLFVVHYAKMQHSIWGQGIIMEFLEFPCILTCILLLLLLLLIIIIKRQFIRSSNKATVTTRALYNGRCSYSAKKLFSNVGTWEKMCLEHVLKRW